jgi:prolyl oligopeptidase
MLDNVRGRLLKYQLQGDRWVGTPVDVPDMGSVNPVDVDVHSNRFFFTYSSFLQPTTLYVHQDDGRVAEVSRLPAMFNADGLTIDQHHATSRDGTRVPYWVVRRTDMALDGQSPTLLYAYGGFEISMTSSYSGTTGKVWLERGGVYVMANIRGGGEFGPAWHRAALKENRQRAYDDFLAVAEDLIARRITTPEHLGIMGGSNGGLLVGAVMTQRPELFGACIPMVGVMDMLRFHKFTAGRFWVDDYGSSDDPEEFEALSAYSPYQNLKPGTKYPPTLVTTADTDDRVVPGHSFKFAARLQECHTGENPVLIRIETRAGHGAGKPTSKLIEEIADQWAFLVHTLGMTLE